MAVPASLEALWRLHTGVQGGGPAVFLLGNWALMDVGSAIEVYRVRMEVGDEDLWKPHWLRFARTPRPIIARTCTSMRRR